MSNGSYQTVSRPVQTQLRAVLNSAVSELPAHYRSVIVLHDVEGLSMAEVADGLDITVPTAKTRAHRAGLFLRWRNVEMASSRSADRKQSALRERAAPDCTWEKLDPAGRIIAFIQFGRRFEPFCEGEDMEPSSQVLPIHPCLALEEGRAPIESVLGDQGRGEPSPVAEFLRAPRGPRKSSPARECPSVLRFELPWRLTIREFSTDRHRCRRRFI